MLEDPSRDRLGEQRRPLLDPHADRAAEPSGELRRPLPPRRLADLASAWLAWFGLGRLIASASAILIVVAGMWWLLRVPMSPASLPVTSAAVPATLPPPQGSPPVTSAAAQAGTSPAAFVVVHVAGAVTQPGVVVVENGARVADAIAAAGGPTGVAELDAVNLAAHVGDGQRLYVPEVGELDPATLPGATPGGPDEPTPTATVGPVDLNAASTDQLEQLPGVGPATAAAIVDDRARNGPFASVDDLDRVPGIGPAKLAALRDLVTV